MATYRIYMLDQTGRVVTASDESCTNDAAAFACAAATLGSNAATEIWQGARRLGIRQDGVNQVPHLPAAELVVGY